MLRIAMTTLLTLGLFGCMADTGEGSVSYNQDALRDKIMCGGIAGLQCPSGMRCQITEDYPDAAGTCVGHADTLDCSAVRCMIPACAEGYEPVLVGNSCCNYMCKKIPGHTTADEGSCTTPSDCEGLPHIMCVGAWSCDAGYCAYTCDTISLEL